MEEGGRIVASPEWGGWIIWYFYLGGIAAGAYFVSTMIDLFGYERDRPLAKIGYYIAAPLVAICGVLLIVDLTVPQRFWHMLIESKTGQPMFKYWSPMSVGSWGLSVFGFFSGLSFVGALAEDGRFGLGRFRNLAELLHRGVVGTVFQVLGTLSGFFLASYTGALLTATNVPFWSDSTLISGLFLASAASTGIATMILLAAFFLRNTPHDSIESLERTDRWAMVLELILLVAFFVSLGSLGPILLASGYGIALLVGTLLIGILIPLGLHFAPQLLGGKGTLVAATLVLIGGFVLRYAVVSAGEHLVVAGR